MRAFFGRMNPTLRGLLIVALIALVVVVLQLETTRVSETWSPSRSAVTASSANRPSGSRVGSGCR